jgi:elongation factor P--(R)-beta-lysine ligase
MSKTRKQFLQEHWLKYPETPRGALRFGRVYQMRLGHYNLTDWHATEDVHFKGSDVLIDGDLIAIMPGAKFVLLAPNLTDESLFYSAESDPWLKQKAWFEFLNSVRKFFNEKKILEVKTETLVKCPGTEPTLEAFETEFIQGSKKIKYFLPTSPEIQLKKILANGADKIFEIASVFRNGEKTERHHFEFTMLEWYRSYAPLSMIKHDMIELIEYLADQLKVARPKEILTYSMAELFKKYCGFDFTPSTSMGELKELASKLNVDVKCAETLDDYFYLIYMEKIENQWPPDRLVFVDKYPPYQAALARIDHQGWAERFEVYWNGLELANAFHELNDPVIQRQRSQEDIAKRKQFGFRDIGLDESFFQALEKGMPPSSGVALGLERLFMALKGIKHIEQVKG